MSAKRNYIFFGFFECKSKLVYITAHGIERASQTEKVRARAALCSTHRRHFINNRPIRAKLCEKLPHCLRNKKPYNRIS